MPTCGNAFPSGNLGVVDDATHTELEALVGDWLTVPDLAEELGMSLRQVRQMIADREIVAARVGERNVVAVPASFVQDGAVVTPLMGTVTVLSDAGFSDEEAIRWLCTPDETLPIDGAPIDMLRAGRKTEVRKRAMEEAF
ncbi:Rv2175c family DNA-binding protein [Dermacoccus barathri]|uniref:Rv2175c family DNA-binding protein n=1 Tax=Dermacoccus barathri TaxID=322601 RepID=A0ABN2C0E0_9MICO